MEEEREEEEEGSVYCFSSMFFASLRHKSQTQHPDLSPRNFTPDRHDITGAVS